MRDRLCGPLSGTSGHTATTQLASPTEHGTSIPEQWKIALKCRRLPEIARESAALFEEESGLRDVICRVVGVPRPVAVLTEGRIQLGSILKLAMGIAPVEHALCAHVRGQAWL